MLRFGLDQASSSTPSRDWPFAMSAVDRADGSAEWHRAAIRVMSYPRFGMSSPRMTAGRARPRSSQAGTCFSALKSTSSPAS